MDTRKKKPKTEMNKKLLMDKQLVSVIKQKYPSISGTDDLHIYYLFSKIQDNSDARRVLLETKQNVLAPMDLNLARQTLRELELPEGWGNFLLSLTNPLIEKIPLGEFDFSTVDPFLDLLLKMIIFHALFVNKEGNRQENGELTRDEAFADSLAGTAQELLDVLKLMPKLRNGGIRLFQRMLSCINKLMETTY